jgi:hypothetical protein
MPDHVQHQVIVTGFDFTPYTAKGFLFTPLPPSGDYESVGLVSVRIQPEIVKAKPGEPMPKGYRETEYKAAKYWVEELSPSTAIKEMYNTAVTMGANALTQFAIESDRGSYDNIPISVTIYKVSGFAVKRK